MVIIIGRASGVSPTARARAKRRELKTPFASKVLTMKINMVIAKIILSRKLLKILIFFCKSPSSEVDFKYDAVLPKKVSLPVPITTPYPEPPATDVPMKAILFKSCGK